MEAIIFTKIGMPTLRTIIPRTVNAKAISKDLDMANKLREATTIRIESYQQKMENLYNKCIKLRPFRAEDLVLRKIFENAVDPAVDKFQPNWEGPYVIVRVGPSGSLH